MIKIKLGKYRLIKQHDKYPKGYTVEAIEQGYDKLVFARLVLEDLILKILFILLNL